MDQLDSHQRPLHIAVFPWMNFSHMIPLLELSKLLAKRGHQVSYISTPRNISRLPKLPPNLSSLIHFIPLTLPKVPDLPEDAEATSDIPLDKVQYLKVALDGLQQPFVNFLKECSCSSSEKKKQLDWIILDYATHWAPSLASQFSIPCVLFTVFTASALAFMGPEDELTPNGSRTQPEHFTVPPKWIPFSSNFAYSLPGAQLLLNHVFSHNVSGIPDICRFASTLRACKLVSPRACMELEPECLRLLPHLYNKPVIPVGLLQSSSSSSSSSKTDQNGDINNVIMKWLDKQKPKSVAYIAFGSETILSIELLHELALGLEMSELHFLWALRKPAGFEGEVLPEGFEERTRERGLVVSFGSVHPHLDVLGHSAVGAFLTHSILSSVSEALQFGHPLVLLPIFANQDINNARMVEHRGFGMEVKRKKEEDGGSFDREAVASALRLVLVDDEGMEIRLKAKELSALFADHDDIQGKQVDDFVKHLREYHTDGHQTPSS